MTNNDDRMMELLAVAAPHLKAIQELMDQTQVLPVDVLKALYLVDNVKKISKYGKVGFTIKDGEVIAVWQEQQMLSDNELKRSLNRMLNSKQ